MRLKQQNRAIHIPCCLFPRLCGRGLSDRSSGGQGKELDVDLQRNGTPLFGNKRQSAIHNSCVQSGLNKKSWLVRRQDISTLESKIGYPHWFLTLYLNPLTTRITNMIRSWKPIPILTDCNSIFVFPVRPHGKNRTSSKRGRSLEWLSWARTSSPLMEPMIHYRDHKSPPLYLIFSQMKPVYTSPYFSNIYFNFILPYTSNSS